MDVVGVLRRSVDLGGASDAGLEKLAKHVERLDAPAGTVVYEEGDTSDSAYLIELGSVRIASSEEDGEASYVADVGAGELLGEMTAFTQRPRTTGAYVTDDAVLWRIPVEPLRELLAEEPDVTLKMMCSAMELVLEKDLTVIMGRRQTSELRRAVDLERRAAEQLREGTQMRDERVAMMAHDIRSPVTVIQGCVEMLRTHQDVLEPERRDKLLEAIYRQGMGLLDLVNDALQVTSIEAGSVRYDVRPFDIVKLALDMVDDLRNADRELDIGVDAPADIPRALGDERHHWRILFNLLSNAIKFSPEGERIDVRISRAGDEIQVHVVDRGPGIPAAAVPTLFEKYARVERSPEQLHPESTGLGLYICRSMVEAQGGKIWVDTEPGRGSTFSYTLPVATPGP